MFIFALSHRIGFITSDDMPTLPSKYITERKADRVIPIHANKVKDSRYALNSWKNYSKRIRSTHPMCGHCNQLFMYDELAVDHIVPLSEGGAFWDSLNHMVLCVPCHSRKTIAEQGKTQEYQLNERGEKIPNRLQTDIKRCNER